jgi:septal ring factor EnvC (AmiA/AmiB activator)
VDIDTLSLREQRLKRELALLDSQLTQRKQKYVQSLRAARQTQATRNPVLFVFSAKSFPQLYRRLRYARERARLQRQLGIALIEKQNQVRDKQNQLLAAKQEATAAVQEVIRQRRQLAREHSVVRADVAQLRRREQELEQHVAKQQQQLQELTKKIDQLVAYEIEQARKRAEAEARRKREAEEAARKAREAKEAQQKAKKQNAQKQKTKGKTSPTKTDTRTATPAKWLTAEDRQLNGSIEHNRGRLPVPITGPYRIERRFGLNRISSSVTLENKGVNYMGQAGARARAIFDGEVSAVFEFAGLRNVLVRHGSYISVYCNLSSTIVQRGQHVKARDILGTVAADEQGNHILHFQLRRETQKLNPESWIGR